MTGRRVQLRDLLLMDSQFRYNQLTRMIIFSPVRYLEPQFLAKYTQETMLRFLRVKSYQSVYFVYGLHYNTDYPHSHVIMTSYLPYENIFKKPEIIFLRDIARKVFNEPIGVKAYEMFGALREYERITDKKYSKDDVKRAFMEEMEKIEGEMEQEDMEIEEFREIESVEQIFEMDLEL